MNERGFKSGDKVYINCPGRWNGRVGKVMGRVKSNDDRLRNSFYVDFDYDTSEPLSEIFAAEHLELVVDPEEEEKAGEIKDSGERTELTQEFIFEIPFNHIEAMTFGDNALQIKCKTSKKELNGEEK